MARRFPVSFALPMRRIRRAPPFVRAVPAALLVLALASRAASAQAPTVDDFKRALDAQLQRLRPTGFTQRTLLFENVRPGTPSGGYHPFYVTATLHDYGPGYPANRYYGQTCVGRMDNWKFDMRRGDDGGWIVQGRMTVSDGTCTDNPSAGASAVPVTALAGTRAPAANGAASPARPATGGAPALATGEYACYGTGGRLLAGMGFHLHANGRYNDVDGARAGSYRYDATTATVSFRGGFLDGQTGRNVRNNGFALSGTVTCEPYR